MSISAVHPGVGKIGAVRARRPRRERKLQRLAQNLTTRAAMRDDDQALAAGDNVRGFKRSHFQELDRRREITLGEYVKRHARHRWTEVGRKKGRGVFDSSSAREYHREQKTSE